MHDTSRKRRSFVVPEEWTEEFDGGHDHDPQDREHYRQFRNLKRTLRDQFNVRPERFFPTRNQRGVVKLDLIELYWLMYEDDDQPQLVVNGAEVTAQAEDGPHGDPMSVQHRQEVEDARTALAALKIYPASAAPTRDFRGRVQLTFDELQRLLVGEPTAG